MLLFIDKDKEYNSICYFLYKVAQRKIGTKTLLRVKILRAALITPSYLQSIITKLKYGMYYSQLVFLNAIKLLSHSSTFTFTSCRYIACVKLNVFVLMLICL